MRFLKYFSIAAVLLAGILAACRHKENIQTINGDVFGTYYSIKIKTTAKDTRLQEEIKKIFDNINQTMSVFEPASELNEINRAPAGKKISVSQELHNILKVSEQIHKKSNGYFDPTVAPLVELWGFGINKQHKEPAPEQIKKILAYSGFNRLNISSEQPQLTKQKKETTLNLSAIAKGLAVDKVAEMLKSKGYDNFIIDIGGEIYASGSKNSLTDGWNIGIAAPIPDSNKSMFVITLKDMAVATSGDYRNFFVKNGRRYSHAISPKTGRPVEHNLVSVTVFSPSCMLADAYATAILSAGEEEGLQIADKNNIAAILFVKNANRKIDVVYSQAARKMSEGSAWKQ